MKNDVSIIEVMDNRREEELKALGFCKEQEKTTREAVYSIKAKYKSQMVDIKVDRDYIRSKGENTTKEILFPYLALKLKRRNADINVDDIDIGFYKGERKVKFSTFAYH